MEKIKDIDMKILTKIPRSLAYEKLIIPFRNFEDDFIEVIAENIEDDILEYLNFIYKKEMKIVFESRKNIIDMLNSCYGSTKKENNKKEIEKEIIKDAISKRASDIHFEPFQNEVLIRYRIDGKLFIEGKLIKEEYMLLVSRIKVWGNMDIAEKRKFQDGKIKYIYEDINRDLRCSTIPTIYGEKLVIRILNKDKSDIMLENLNMENLQKSILQKIIDLKSGLVVVNGPTGSGKSTTLYSIINSINNGSLNITTIEDPVEVYIDGVNQVNVNNAIGVSFAKGLRSILRQDPDVIMIGEIRDEETAKIAVRSAITGHKVYSTIHTSTPLEVLHRLKDMGIDEYLIIDAIKAIISQRLVRKVCKCCRERIQYKNKIIYKAVGCNICHNTGYEGRVMVCEILFLRKEEKSQIRKYLESGKVPFGLIDISIGKRLKELLYKGIIDIKEFNDFVKGEYYYDEYED